MNKLGSKFIETLTYILRPNSISFGWGDQILFREKVIWRFSNKIFSLNYFKCFRISRQFPLTVVYQLTNLESFIEQVEEKLPKLSYLSLLGNEACPNQLSNCQHDEDDYKRYRLLKHHLPRPNVWLGVQRFWTRNCSILPEMP